MEVHVIQGEREMAQYNRTLGKFHLVGIPPAPRGVPQIEVTFDIDANGIVNVSAKDQGTGKEQKITITASSGLDDSEIEKMVRDGEEHAQEDQERRKKVEARNQLDTLVYSTEKSLGEHKEKLPADDVGALESALEQAKKALENDDLAEVEAATQKLTEASHKLAEVMYQAASQEQAAAGDAGDGAPKEGAAQDDDVIDAEYVDSDEKAS